MLAYDTQINQWKRRKKPEIDPHFSDHLIFDRGTTVIQHR